MFQQRFGFRQAGRQHRLGHRLAVVIAEVALAAQGVEYHQTLGLDPHALGQRLQCSLVVARLAGGGAVTISQQSHHGALQDGLVGGVEAVVGAQRLQLRIRQVAVGRRHQPRYRCLVRRHALQTLQGQQIVQSHLPLPV
ncbi:hypothetical protein D3C78_1554580 [compost metagenome]